MEDFKKKISYIWYYYKAPIIIILIIMFIVGNDVIANKKEAKTDNSIAIISKANYPSEEEVKRLKETFETKFEGKFDVVIYNVSLGSIGEDDVIISKLSLDLANKISSYWFIEDMEKFKESTNNLELNEQGFGKDFVWLNNCGVDNFYYCTR